MEPVIEVTGLSKKFGGKEVLHGVDFNVPTGSIFGVIGPNGAGKTTIMRCLLDVIRPSSGTLRVLGQNPTRGGPALRRRIGYLPGELILEGRTTGRRILEHFAAVSGPVRQGMVDSLAERLDLDLDNQARRLSKGNKQKLGLVQAFMHEPELLVLDEPTSGLDPLRQQEFLALIREAKDNGQTVFLSSHVLSEIQQAADEVAILREGSIVTVSTVDHLRESAIRHVRVLFPGDDIQSARARCAEIPGISNLEVRQAHDGSDSPVIEGRASIEGPVEPLVQALSKTRFLDLVIEEPDLEESVLKMYSADPADKTPTRRGGSK
ncbi:ABC transporter ATP-binding protein [Paeniglutamicibacter sp. ZC-3]|uniref:ABC transporter ATP-binding protein n=1 Tax=Paeniglutamicibacter sp. ZC-3 TaxID=2986919 RepID=UPI0021F7BFBD|nr:ABC transporter ATP-binding protein [Paeniglutamicibacter sp. ZC-3]MCV9994133.1 ABC transporter ATP-binding protein [Paeniglutamicibacter sp. ZC-3]